MPLVDGLNLRWAVRDMDIRSRLISSTLQEPLVELLQKGERSKINALLLRINKDERLLALGICDKDENLIYRTAAFPASLSCKTPEKTGKDPAHLIRLPQGPVHVALNPLELEETQLGSLVLVHDMSYMERRSADTRKYVIISLHCSGW